MWFDCCFSLLLDNINKKLFFGIQKIFLLSCLASYLSLKQSLSWLPVVCQDEKLDLVACVSKRKASLLFLSFLAIPLGLPI